MKYVLIFISICCIEFSSCKKDGDASKNNYIRGKFDGVDFECDELIRASPAYGIDSFVIISGLNHNNISIQINIGEPSVALTPKVYFLAVGNNYSTTIYWHTAGYFGGYSCMSGPCIFKGGGQVTLQEINSDYVKGTFELSVAAGATGNLKNVSGGFRVKIQ